MAFTLKNTSVSSSRGSEGMTCWFSTQSNVVCRWVASTLPATRNAYKHRPAAHRTRHNTIEEEHHMALGCTCAFGSVAVSSHHERHHFILEAASFCKHTTSTHTSSSEHDKQP
eukprot:scaffold16696_cov89-Skeletonema_marinoi.AAC.3